MELAACPDDHALGEFLDRTLVARRRDDIEHHIDVCAACRMALSHAWERRGPAASELATLADGADAPELGGLVGRYQLCDVLGAGGMGVVYAAHDPELNRRVAVKVLRDDLEPGAGDQSLRDEAQTLARISHPNVLAVHDVGRVGGRRFIAMELVDGTTLRGYLAQRTLAWRDRLRLLVGVGRGLAAAHAIGIVHRDVKPDNVLIGTDGRPRVSDFGLARITVAPEQVQGDGTVSTAAGTPAYLAPELRAGARATAASDQFAFATMCWEVLIGTRPVAALVVPGRPRDLRRVLAVLVRALAGAPTARWPSVTALVDALEAAARPRRRGLRALAVLAAAGGVALVIAGGRRDREAGGPPPTCAAIATRASALWDPPQAAAMRDAFARLGLDGAANIADIVDAGLQRATDDWRATATAACQHDPVGFAGGAGPAQCLERRYAQARSLALLFVSADRTAFARSAVVVASLPSSASCLDGRELAEPARPAEWLALAGRLAAAFTDIDLGRTDLARAAAVAVIRDADVIGALALRAEALLILAEIERVAGRLEEAHRLLLEEITLADHAGADMLRAQGLIELGRLAARDLLQPDEAKEALDQARGVLARLGEPPSLSVHLAQTEADLAMARHQPSLAIEHLRHALDVIEAKGLTWRELSARNDLGGAYLAAGRYQEGLDEFERNLAAHAQHAPGRVLASLHINIAGAMSYLGRIDEATAHTEQGIEMLRGLRESRPLAQALGNLGFFYAQRERFADALATAEESLHVTERVLGPAHPDVALRTSYLADLQRDAGHPDQAATTYRAACELFVAALGDHALGLAAPLTSLAELELAAGHPRAALAAADRALEVLRTASAAGAESSATLDDTRRAEEVVARARAASRRSAPHEP